MYLPTRLFRVCCHLYYDQGRMRHGHFSATSASPWIKTSSTYLSSALSTWTHYADILYSHCWFFLSLHLEHTLVQSGPKSYFLKILLFLLSFSPLFLSTHMIFSNIAGSRHRTSFSFFCSGNHFNQNPLN